MAEIPCPMCGKLNPADAETCQFCSARIKPLVARSQPENDGIPDWLASLRGAQDQAGEPEPFS